MRQRLCRACGARQHPNQFPKTETGGVTPFCFTCLEAAAQRRHKQRVYLRKWRAKHPNYFRRGLPSQR